MSPHKPPKRARTATFLFDQHQDDTDHAHDASSPATATMRDASLSPSVSSPHEQSPASPEAEEQLDVTAYARQLSAHLGANFKPVSCEEQSGTQSCFCFPHWSQSTSSLTKQYHVPGIRLTTFEDGQHMTWWCDCCHSLDSARKTFANTDFPDLPSDWLEGRADKCVHLKALEVRACYASSLPSTHM